jgi:hypothetical protein
MELYILASLLSLGYFLKEKGDESAGAARYGKKMYRGNAYDQEQYDRVENEVFDRANVKFNEAQNVYGSNTVGKYTPDVLFHKSQKHALVTNTEQQQQQESFNNNPNAVTPGAWNINQDNYETLEDQFLVGGGGKGQPTSGFDVQQQQQRQPHEAQQQKEPFFHNNMVPFFGSTIKQNVNATANENTLNMYTGQWDYSRKQKQEIAPMFAPEANIQNIYGDQQYLQKMNENLERFIPSLMRTNEAPTEKVYVTPGLNMGYNETAAFGFHDPVRALPKTTNELRAKNKPKLTYDKPVVSGKGLTQHGTARPNQQKNRPELVVYNETGKRNYGAKAVVLGSTERPEYLLGSALRSVSKFFLGGAKGVEHMQPKLPGGATAPTKRKQHLAAGAYVAPGTAAVKKQPLLAPDAAAKETKRKQQTEQNAHKGYFTSVIKRQTTHTDELARKTVKQTTEANTHGGGKLNLKSAHLAATVHDPLDKPAYTLKDMVKVENYTGNAHPTVKKISVWNPDSKAKTTVKQTTLVKDYVGGKNTAQNGGAYAVLKVAPKYTQRQDVLVENYTGGAGAVVAAAQDYDAAYNAETNALKEQVAAGRAPTQNSVKLAVGGDMQNVDVKRLDTDRKNPRDFEQDLPNANVPFQVLPTANAYSITKEKNTVSNQSNIDRMQPDLLDAYRNNPYTQSLHSYVFP